MLKLLEPDYYYPDIFAIELDKLKAVGIKGIICDIDNTLVPYGEKEFLSGAKKWLTDLEDEGFAICLVSNGLQERVDFFSQQLELPAIGQAAKPTKKSFVKALNEILDMKASEVAVIGDQIFTDVLGGNRLNLKTVLVDPLGENEFIVTRGVRLIERLLFKRNLS